MFTSVVEEIKSRLDVVEVISQYIKLQKTGANYRAPCPFHSEKKGSFFVSPSKQIWHCFGCQKGGDIFGFVKEIEGVEFGDALRILASRAGVELKKQTPEAVQLKTERQRFYEICELAAKFFERQLEAGKAGLEVKNYLLGRGLTGQSIMDWRIGYAPDSWHGLSNFLSSNGYKNSEVEKAGLAVRSEIGSIHDRFRGRIMFPILDFNSQPIGFGGRIFRSKGKDDAKYINTPNTILYDKSRVLYGLDRAKVEIRKKNACILVEGYTDVIMSVQAGIGNIVSSSGTALTPFQLKILKRYTDNLILGYDMDLAGDTANRRGIDLAQEQGFSVKVARPPFEGKDPADVIKENPEEWKKAVDDTKSIMEFYFENAFSRSDRKTPDGKKNIASILLPSIKKLVNQIEKAFWLQKLARELDVREDDLRKELDKIKEEPERSDERQDRPKPEKKPRNALLEERLLVLILKYAKYIESVEEAAMPFFSESGLMIINGLKGGAADFEKKLPSGATDYYNLLCLRSEVEEIEEKEAGQEIKFHLMEIQEMRLRSELETLAKDIMKAESADDCGLAAKLKEKYNALSKSVCGLDKNKMP